MRRFAAAIGPNRSCLAVAVLAWGLGVSTSATADWIFSGVNGGAANTTITGNPSSDPTLTIAGLFAANGAANSGFAAGATWASGSLTFSSAEGLGMASDGGGAPNDAIDNNGTNTEAVMLSFASSVVLNSIGIGYVSGDADISLFRYTGGGSPTLIGVGASLSSMVAAGWALVGNYPNLLFDTTNPYNPVNAGGASSSWWLVTAYNSNYGSGASLSQGDDFFKPYAVAATPTSVPEPATLALLGLGLSGLALTRRRKLH